MKEFFNKKNRKKVIFLITAFFICCIFFINVNISFAETIYKIGDKVTFGKFEQDNDTENGKEDIEWQILDKNEDCYLLFSTKILDAMQFNVTYGYVTYANSTLRKYLNTTFYNSAFDANEKNQIIKIKNTNPPNVKFNIDGGANTDDYAFVLSKDEFVKYLGEINSLYENKEATAIGTMYAFKRGLEVNNNEGMWCNGYSSYWLRTPGSYRTAAIYVASNGGYIIWGDAVNNIYGVRPAIWVKLK